MSDIEPIVHDLWRDARTLSVAPVDVLAPHEGDLIEAREAINDALAKIDRAAERAACRNLFEDAA